jgi:hypothetical protein
VSVATTAIADPAALVVSPSQNSRKSQETLDHLQQQLIEYLG